MYHPPTRNPKPKTVRLSRAIQFNKSKLQYYSPSLARPAVILHRAHDEGFSFDARAILQCRPSTNVLIVIFLNVLRGPQDV